MRVRAYDQPVTYGGAVDQLIGWTVVLPVKGLEHAKRRLAPDVGSWRMSLAAAFAADTLEATLASADVLRVLVVGGEGIAGSTLAQPRVTQLPDVGDLDAAVSRGTTWAREQVPHCPILVLQADLPCLRASDLENLVDAAPATRPGVLADAEGLGTVALTLPAGTSLSTAFGAGSFAHHVRAGADPIDVRAPHLRRDVDTLEHLRDAVRLGVGRATRQVLERMQFPSAQHLTTRWAD